MLTLVICPPKSDFSSSRFNLFYSRKLNALRTKCHFNINFSNILSWFFSNITTIRKNIKHTSSYPSSIFSKITNLLPVFFSSLPFYSIFLVLSSLEYFKVNTGYNVIHHGNNSIWVPAWCEVLLMAIPQWCLMPCLHSCFSQLLVQIKIQTRSLFCI
jgi:hypothetical protein